MNGEGASFTPAGVAWEAAAPCGRRGGNGIMSWEQRPVFAISQRGILNNTDHLTSMYR
jgi:hypothetical protein